VELSAHCHSVVPPAGQTVNGPCRDRDTFRARCDRVLVPGAAEAVLAFVDDPIVFSFAICVGSVARGTARPGSDVDVYAEVSHVPAGDVNAPRRRLAPFGIDFVMPPSGHSLETWFGSGDPMARSWVAEALILFDPAGTFAALRSRLAAGKESAQRRGT
jgi:hypothetical protein